MSRIVSAAVVPPAEAASQVLIQLGTGHFVASALQVVARLGIPARLADGARTIADLADAAGVEEDTLYRMLRALAGAGLFDETSPRVFVLTEAGRLLRPGVPGSMHDIVLRITSPFHVRADFLSRDPELSAIFTDTMTAFGEIVVPAAVDAYDFTGIDTLVDVGGGHGAVLTAILRRYPGMRGVLFDLDHVIAGARPRIEAEGLADRCRTEVGDFFTKITPGGDAYIMKHVIHDWQDDEALLILQNIRTAIGAGGGRVILLESVLPAGNAPDFSRIIDLEMALLPGRKERTADAYEALFTRTGFELTKILATGTPLSVIEARLV